MPRPHSRRKVCKKPAFEYFKPAGIPLNKIEEITLTIDEYEAIRLKDHLVLDQTNASAKMNVSQPTFHRLLLSARKKISQAIVKGKAIRIEGGHYAYCGEECEWIGGRMCRRRKWKRY
ncbi:MAG: DUF134 domain-containing protein [Candidatus Woesearchaeota archaeon]